MTSPSTSILHCADGTELPVDWAYAGAEECEWVWNRAHWPDPFTPMELWLRQTKLPGADRAWKEAGIEAPPRFYRFQLAGPFSYVRTTPFAPERMADISARYQEVARRHGGIRGFWQRYCEPRIRQAGIELASAPAGVSLSDAAETWGYGHEQTFTSAAMLMEATQRLTTLLAESVGEDAILMAFEVTQGGENASQAIDSEIWDLAELARRTPAVARLLGSTSQGDTLQTLRREPRASAFVARFDSLLERHGSRSQGWDLVRPTWREQPEAPLTLVHAQLESEGVSPSELTARSASRRREATEQALAHLPVGKHDEFARIVAELDGYVGVREGRAYWQMVIVGEVRGLLLRKGADLVRSARIDRADDILFLVPEDLADDAISDMRALVEERRKEWERWRQVVPPDTIGTLTAVEAQPGRTSGELRGTPASRGQVTGPARILHSPDDGPRLFAGDIMVCVMTTPAWTPLFSIAAGIITETGGALSHPAITAREYGIPAVVAVKDATARIADGQLVTIDGGSGVISFQR